MISKIVLRNGLQNPLKLSRFTDNNLLRQNNEDRFSDRLLQLNFAVRLASVHILIVVRLEYIIEMKCFETEEGPIVKLPHQIPITLS